MPHYLSDEELRRVAPAEIASFRSPIPTQIVSNGAIRAEYLAAGGMRSNTRYGYVHQVTA